MLTSLVLTIGKAITVYCLVKFNLYYFLKRMYHIFDVSLTDTLGILLLQAMYTLLVWYGLPYIVHYCLDNIPYYIPEFVFLLLCFRVITYEVTSICGIRTKEWKVSRSNFRWFGLVPAEFISGERDTLWYASGESCSSGSDSGSRGFMGGGTYKSTEQEMMEGYWAQNNGYN